MNHQVTAAAKTKTPRKKRDASPVKKDPFVEEDSYINLDNTLLEDSTSSRTLSIDESTAQPGPATPLQPGDVATPKTIFQTAQKDVFKSAFKSAVRDNSNKDIFMTAKPTRTWTELDSEDYQSSPLVPEQADDSSMTLSFDQDSNTLDGTPSISSKRGREEDEDQSLQAIPSSVSKRFRRTPSPVAQGQVLLRLADDDDEPEQSTRYIAELDTSALTDDENSGFESSSSWSLESPPPGLDRKARKSWKRQQRRAKGRVLEQTYGTKPRVAKRSARPGFKPSLSGRQILIGNARRRFWEGRVAKNVSCY